jgi:hypothetical protein
MFQLGELAPFFSHLALLNKPLLLALVSGDIRDDEEFTDVTLA